MAKEEKQKYGQPILNELGGQQGELSPEDLANVTGGNGALGWEECDAGDGGHSPHVE